MKNNYLPPETAPFSVERKAVKTSLFLTMLVIFSWNFITAQVTTVTVNGPAAANFTVPAGVTLINIQAWGGGGAGGGSTINNVGGSGGGGGAYTQTNNIAVTPGQIIPYVVGAGGTGVVGLNGNPGVTTTILTLISGGGSGGGFNSGPVGAGGIASGGTTSTNGFDGLLGGASGGNGGASPSGGAGGAGGLNATGATGSAPGGGGGGSEIVAASRAGGNGGAGRIVITYIRPTITTFAPANGCISPSTSVVITGTNFTGATSVTFNGIASTYTVNSATQITANVPAGSSTGSIVVTVPTGFATSAVSFTVNPQPSVGPITGTTSICPGGTTTLSNATPGGVWNSSNPAAATVNAGGLVTASATGGATTTISYTITNGNGCSDSASTLFTVYAKPVLSGPSSVCIGATGITFSSSTGAGTWTSSNPSTAVINNSGNVTTVATGSTTFTFTDAVTSCTATTLTFNVTDAPSIISQPVPTQTVCKDDPVSLSISATGGSLTYQWYNGATPVVNGGNISGATTDTLNFVLIGTANASSNYHCTVSNSCGTLDSTPAEVNVNLKPTIFARTVSICSSDTFLVDPVDGVPTSTTEVPVGTSYSWASPSVTGGITGGSAQSGQASISQTLVNPTNTVQTATYTVIPTSGTSGNCIGLSFTVTVTVNPVSDIINLTPSICSGATFSVTPTNGGGNIVPAGTTYSWLAPSVTGGLTGGGALSGQTSISQTLNNPTNAVQTATYNITATSGTCLGSTFTMTITVNPKPTVAGSVASQSMCSGDNIAPITITNPNNVPGVSSYTWTRDNVNITGLASGSGNIISGALTNTTSTPQTTIFTLIATSEEGCLSLPNTVSVTVDPVPLPVATPASQTICSGVNAAVAFTNSNGVAGATYTWSRDKVVEITGIPANGSGNISSILTNTTGVSQTMTITVTASANGCSKSISTVTITVKPAPSVSGSTTTPSICSGNNFDITINNPNNVAGTVFSYTKDNPTVTASGVVLSGNSLTGTLANPTTIDQIVNFTLTATAGGCFSSTTVTITVKPSPSISAPATLAICNNTNLNLNITSAAGTTYTWSWTGPNVTGTPLLAGNTISGILTNNTTSSQTATFLITGTLNGCVSTAITVVTVYSGLAAPVISESQTVCAGQRPTPLVISTLPSGGNAAYTYQWQTSLDATGPWANIGGATASSYWPPNTNALTPTMFYQLIVTGCGSATSNIVSVTVANNVNFTFSVSGGSTTICPGAAFNPTVTSAEFLPDSYIRYTWAADVNYIAPSTGGPVGTTTVTYILGIPLFAISTATLSLTGINNTNAPITTTVFITPTVYDASSNVLICALSPQSTTVTIYPRPIATALSVPTGPICSGTNAGIVIDGNLTGSTMNFSWIRTDGNANVTSSQSSGNVPNLSHPNNFFTIPDVLTNTSGSVQSVTYTVTPSSPNCTGTPITVTIQVNPVLNPGVVAANQTICSGGDPAAFTETTPASGAGTISYQWQSGLSATGPWTNIPGATAATYDAPTGLTVTTYYRRVVTATVNSVTCSVGNTTPVSVTINTIVPGSITADQTVCDGGNPGLFGSVAATGSGAITYQWQSSTTGCGGPWADIGGATAATLDVAGPVTVTTYYRRIGISTFNGTPCSDYSNCIVVTINTVTGGTIGSDQVLCGTTNPAAFTQIAASTGLGALTYQWQSSTTGCAGPWTTIGGATSSTYDAASVSGATYFQRITISTLNGAPCSAASNCILVTANSVTGGVISGNRTVCSGGDPAAFTVTVASTGANLSYQWQSSTTGGAGPWTDILSATSPTYDVPGPVTATTYYQRVTFGTIGAATCQALSNFVTVFVNDVSPATIAGDQTLCALNDPAAFTNPTPASGSGTLTYQWQSSTVGCAGPWTTVANTVAYDPPAVAGTTYYHVIVTSTINAVQCTATSNCVTVTNLSKTWNGSISADWNTAANWTPVGIPTAANCVVVPNVTTDPIVLSTNYVAFAKTLTILSGGRLDVNPTNSIVVTDEINVNALGNFFITNNASLVQVNNAVNVGNAVIVRITQPMYRFDYTYWNSPVTLGSGYSLGALSPNTQYDKYYSWNPSVSNGNGTWIQESVASIMDPKKGYIVRAPNSFSTNPAITQTYTATFIGTPNNGDVPIPIKIGTLGAGTSFDKLNLIGNPYASAVDADLFLQDATNVPVIDGTIYFWTHHAPPSAAYPDPFYGDFVLNYSPAGYASYNSLGGTNTVPAGYGGSPPNGYIASGQSFFALGLQTGTAMFRNDMRVTGNNNVFFRTTNPYTASTPSVERHRVWLNFAGEQGSFSQMLVGYAEGATNELDRGYDGEFFNSNAVSLYSVNSGKRLSIQGRALPFDENDKIPLGYNATLEKTFTIGIDHVDGLFESQNIYLEDKLTNTIYDIRESAFTFSTSAGTFDDRFILRFTNTALGVPTTDDGYGVTAFIKDARLYAKAGQAIVTIKVYDISGKLVRTYVPGETINQFDEEFVFSEGIYFGKIKLENGITATVRLFNRE
jgi:hypothetical protein